MSNVKIKLCSMRRAEDIEYINEYKPDFAGFILSEGFKRTIDNDTYLRLISALDKSIKTVGVFVNEPVEKIVNYPCLPDIIQLHGDEDANYIASLKNAIGKEIWKAVRVKTPQDIESADKLPCDMLVIDSYSEACVGGNGKRVNLDNVLNAEFSKPYMIAGGITPINAAEVIRALSSHPPFGIDTSGGVETDGVKDKNKIEQLIKSVRSISQEKEG